MQRVAVHVRGRVRGKEQGWPCQLVRIAPAAHGDGVRENLHARRIAAYRLDILLNNAGVCIWSGFLDSTLETWNQTLATNLTAVYLLSREAARPMIAQRWGRIINVGSYVSVIGRERLQAYAASTTRAPASA